MKPPLTLHHTLDPDHPESSNEATEARGLKQMKQGQNKIRVRPTADDERGARRAWRLADSDTTLAQLKARDWIKLIPFHVGARFDFRCGAAWRG